MNTWLRFFHKNMWFLKNKETKKYKFHSHWNKRSRKTKHQHTAQKRNFFKQHLHGGTSYVLNKSEIHDFSVTVPHKEKITVQVILWTAIIRLIPSDKNNMLFELKVLNWAKDRNLDDRSDIFARLDSKSRSKSQLYNVSDKT